jgi:hypothetical protein
MQEPDPAVKGATAVASCSRVLDELPGFVEEILTARRQPEGTSILGHLQCCPRCARTYGSLIQLRTAGEVDELESAVVDDLRPTLPAGLLDVWRIQLGLRNLHDDLHAAAAALAVMGMIHRQRERFGDARELYELALETLPVPSNTTVVCRTELAYLGFVEGRHVEAVRQLGLGALAARQIDDREGAGRLAVLRSKGFARSAGKLLSSFYASWLEPAYLAESEGEKILVINTGAEIPIKLWFGPEVDADGRVWLGVGMDEATLTLLPETFVMDILFIPTGDLIGQRVVAGDERLDLILPGRGIEISAELPDNAPVVEHLRQGLDTDATERRRLARRTCELRLWWEP